MDRRYFFIWNSARLSQEPEKVDVSSIIKNPLKSYSYTSYAGIEFGHMLILMLNCRYDSVLAKKRSKQAETMEKKQAFINQGFRRLAVQQACRAPLHSKCICIFL